MRVRTRSALCRKAAQLICSAVALALLAGAAGAASGTGAATLSTHGCSVVVHPGSGLARTVDHARPGEAICLAPGYYDAERLIIGRSGTAAGRITFESIDPHHQATIHGAILLSNSANYWTFAYLHLDSRNRWNLPSPMVSGDYSIWDHVDVTNYHAGAGQSGGGICFSLGATDSYGRAAYTTIENSRIHDCGVSDNHNHGIYVAATAGTTIIRDNWIYRNGDRGIQLFPAAENVLIANNVIDGNGSGVIFGGQGSLTSRNVVVTGNIISNSQKRWNVESWYPTGTPLGTGNVVTNNCLWPSNANHEYDVRGGVAAQIGFSVRPTNVIQRPAFELAPGGKLVRAPRGGGCRRYGPSPS